MIVSVVATATRTATPEENVPYNCAITATCNPFLFIALSRAGLREMTMLILEKIFPTDKGWIILTTHTVIENEEELDVLLAAERIAIDLFATKANATGEDYARILQTNGLLDRLPAPMEYGTDVKPVVINAPKQVIVTGPPPGSVSPRGERTMSKRNRRMYS